MTEVLVSVEKCSKFLDSKWEEIKEKIIAVDNLKYIEEKYSEIICKLLTSETKSYHYVLPTQVLSKCVNHHIDCRSLQASFNSKGAFDARTIAHKVIVPFDKQNHNVLGGSNEPYVNNPLRNPAVTIDFRDQIKNKEDWDLLCNILQEIEDKNDTEFTENFFSQILCEIYGLLSSVQINYPTPNRISLETTKSIIMEYISEKSGGERLESITTALFNTIGEIFNLFDKVVRSKINAPDSSTGLASDIECWKGEQILLAIEVKDRELSLTQFESTIESARANMITEILFIVEQGIQKSNKEKILTKVNQEFVSGQNVYILDFLSFAIGMFVLFGEEGRVKFLNNIGVELDRVNSSIINKKKWAELLKNV